MPIPSPLPNSNMFSKANYAFDRNTWSTLCCHTPIPWVRYVPGLTMELYIEQHEYIKGLADSAGLRVLVHNQTYMPFPEDDGISIAPGTKTSIGVNKVQWTVSLNTIQKIQYKHNTVQHEYNTV